MVWWAKEGDSAEVSGDAGTSGELRRASDGELPVLLSSLGKVRPLLPTKGESRASGISGLWGSLEAEEGLYETWRHHVTGFHFLLVLLILTFPLLFYPSFSPALHSSP